jgi:acyl transferase domain-containing protein/acyl carrier protein
MKDNFQTKLEDIETRVKEIIVDLLKDINDSLDLDNSFLELGINSILAVELVESINKILGIELGIEVVFDYRDINELAKFILVKYGEKNQFSPRANNYLTNNKNEFELDKLKETVDVKEKNNTNHSILMEDKSLDIAIIGISGKFAGSETIEEFWQHIQAGESCIEEINRKGWKESEYYNPDSNQINKSISKWGGFLKNIDKFDPLFFNISPQEAERMDPQQRLFMEEAFKAFEDGGYCAEQLSGKNVGVFVGARTSDYKDRALHKDEMNSQIFLGTDMSMLSARIGYFLNLHGPCLTIDTACASSLVAIHLACDSLRNKESEIALAGGVFVLSSPEFYVMTSKTNMLSPDGKCKTFDNNANGIVIGEGVGALVLKRLDVAIEDGDHIYGVIKGSAINQDGRTKGITAPSMLSQKDLIYEVYKNSSIDPETISYIEAHGTGTKLGDPIEIKALSEAFRLFTHKNQFCAIGSHKPNFGHTIMSAGIGGVFKILMAMKYRKIPPTINIEKANEHIDFMRSPFFINTKLCEWKNSNGFPLRAGVSSFGFSGTNCHVIIEEPPAHKNTTNNQCRSCFLFAFSAKTKTALSKKLIDMAKWLEKEGVNYLVEDISHTLLMGRSHYSVRHAFIAKDIDELKQRLMEVNENGITKNSFKYKEKSSFKIDTIIQEYVEGIIRELNKNDSDSLTKEIYEKKLLLLSELYSNECYLNWENLFKNCKYNKVPLPTYPFSGKSYWIQEIEKHHNLLNNCSSDFIHPLLHRNTSDLSEQRFSSTFTGEEFFLADHVVKGQRVLPGVAYLEMAREAVELATGALKEDFKGIRLKNVVWARPIVVEGQPVQVHIGLFPEDNGEIAYEIYGEPEAVDVKSVVHSQGIAVLSVDSDEAPTMDLKALQAQCSQQTLSSTECYEAFRAMGIDYGPAHQGIVKIYVGLGQVLAKLSLPSSVSNTQEQFVLHPSLMDSALQASIGLRMGVGETLPFDNKAPLRQFLPFSLQEIEVLGNCTSAMWASIGYSNGSKIGEKQKIDINLCDSEGMICVRIKGLETQENRETVINTSLQTSPQNEPFLKTQEGFEMMTFEEVWQEKVLSDTSPVKIKTIVCFLSNSENQQAMLEAMEEIDKQTKIIFISQSSTYKKHSEQEYSISMTDRSTYEEAFKSIREDYGEVDAMLYLWALEDSKHIQDTSCIVYILQAVISVKLKLKRLLLAGQFKNALERCYMESWIGFERSMGLVLPNTQVAIASQEANEQSRDIVIKDWIEKLWAELKIEKALSVLYQDEKRHVCQIRPTTIQSGNSLLKSGGIYLITGGLGRLGFLFAKHLSKIQPVNLILTGRSPMNAEKQSQVKELEALGSQVLYVQADVCNLTHMEVCLSRAKELFGGINGVIHAAGIQSNHSFLEKEILSFQKVLEPKIKGTLVLDELLQKEALDFICYFSSSAAILGDFGSFDYAIGNRFQMAYAHFRNQQQRQGQRQGKAIVINWPLWKDGGMGFADEKNTKMYLKSSGQRFLETEEGVDIFDRLLIQSNTQHLILVGQPSRVHRFLGLIQGQSSSLILKATSFSGKGRRVEMKGLSLEQCLEWDMKEHISGLLKIPRDMLEREDILADFGFDSISLAGFATLLTNHFQIEITPALFFGHSTLEKLIQYFLHEHQEAIRAFYREGLEQRDISQKAQIVADIPKRQRSSKSRFALGNIPRKVSEPIAIIGMSGRFPQARNIDEMWTILSEGQDVVKEIPEDRFEWRQYDGDPSKEPVKSNRKWCGCIPGVSEFDPTFFEISPREAESMDPRQRLLLQESWKALEDSGYGAKQIRTSKIGMFVGVEQGDYQLLSKSAGSITSNNNAILAARLAYFLNLSGPVMAIDTACSSGLVAVHQAASSLRNLECDTAIAAGVNLLFTSDMYVGMSQAGMLSPDGKCFAFDQRANGMVPGEAVAVVVLKRLSQAKADGDPIYAIIKGSGVNYDGKTNGITAPSGVSQTSLLKEVYDRYQVNPEEIEYVVTHGTGTKLGDPVEINALYDAFKGYTTKQHYCALTSTKTNFGHTFAASGLVSLISLVQALRHETIPASLHCEQENDFINWKESPFYVNKTNKPWPQSNGESRIGAVSAFGMSGTNVHMVLKSYPTEKVDLSIEKLPYYMLAFSAKTQEVLQEKIKDMTAILKRKDLCEQDLLQISYTLLEGRQHFNHRCTIVIRDREDAIYVLKHVGGKEKLPNLFQGKVPRDFTGQRMIEQYTQDLLKQSRCLKENKRKYQEILYALADFYCQGYEIPWTQLYGDIKPRRINLPTYPFARQRYWVSEKKTDSVDGCKTGDKLQKLDINLSDDHGTICVRVRDLACPVESQSSITRHFVQPITVAESIVANISQKPNGISLRTVSDEQILSSKSAGQTQQTITLSKASVSLSQPRTDEVKPVIQTVISVEVLQEELVTSLAEALYMKRSDIDVDKKFIDMGLDSIIGVEWIKAINKQYGSSIMATIVYDYPTICDFSRFLEKELSTQGGQTITNPVSSALSQSSSRVSLQSIVLPSLDSKKVSRASTTQLIASENHADPSISSITVEALQEELVTSLAEALYMKRSDIDVDKKFIDMGLDSIIGVEWIKAINKKYGSSIKATIVYDYPTVCEFVGFLEKELNIHGSGLNQTLLESTIHLSLLEVLQKVHQGTLDIGQAESLLRNYI